MIGEYAANLHSQMSLSACRAGRPITPDELREARDLAEPLVARFWDRALALREAGADKARAREVRIGGKWIGDGVTSRMRSGAFLADPLAPGLALAGEAESFARAGAEPMNDAYGLWRVTAAGDPWRTIAFYRVTFTRFMLQWSIASIEPLPPDAPAEARPFCRKPGDLDPPAGEPEQKTP